VFIAAEFDDSVKLDYLRGGKNLTAVSNWTKFMPTHLTDLSNSQVSV